MEDQKEKGPSSAEIKYAESSWLQTTRPSGAVVSLIPTGDIAVNFYVDTSIVRSETLYFHPEAEEQSNLTVDESEIDVLPAREVVARVVLEADIARKIADLVLDRVPERLKNNG